MAEAAIYMTRAGFAMTGPEESGEFGQEIQKPAQNDRKSARKARGRAIRLP
jgi:hypothetical protein